jgi:predicted MPP superfamily phosphohydrolase
LTLRPGRFINNIASARGFLWLIIDANLFTKGEKMIEFYHISDLHFGDPLSWKRTKRVKDFLKKLCDQYGFKDSNNKYLIVTGDITNSGEVDQYADAREAFLPFKGKIFFVPGNHDYGFIRSVFYDEERAKRFDSILASEFVPGHIFFSKKIFKKEIDTPDEKVLLIGLNSCLIKDMKGSPIQKAGQSIGLLGYKQLDELRKYINSRKDDGYKKIIILHHIPDKYADTFFMDLFDRNDLIEIVGPYTDVFCYGHEGGMPKPEKPTKSLYSCVPIRPMKVRRMNLVDNLGRPSILSLAQGEQGPYSLDANNSIDESVCYIISVNKNNLVCDKLPVGEAGSLSRLEGKKARPTKKNISIAKPRKNTSSRKK